VQDAVVDCPVEKRSAVGSRSKGLGSKERREVAEIFKRTVLEQLHQVDLVARALDIPVVATETTPGANYAVAEYIVRGAAKPKRRA
jgi:hypothetical protein